MWSSIMGKVTVASRSAKNMRAALAFTAVCLAALPTVQVVAKPPKPVAAIAETRPRLIVLTDIGNEPDDSESMVRLLTYANEIEIEGLVATTSRHLSDKTNPQMIEKRVAAYAQVLGNLRVHDTRYPDAEVLRGRIHSAWPALGMNAVGEGKDSEGSRAIIAAVDKADARPVWVAVWGGAATLAQALWSVKATRTPAEVDKFIAKLRVYSISDQDESGPWARATFPHLFWITSVHGPNQYQLATWTGISALLPGADQSMVDRKWLRDNIQKRGALGLLYPTPMFIMEGDTPSFLNLVSNGLAVPDQPNWGGWGGRWEQPSPSFGHWADTTDSVTGTDGKSYRGNTASIWRWRSAFQNDFAARMAWSVTPRFADANHAPRLVVNGSSDIQPLRLSACPDEAVPLSAEGSIDPDGNTIAYRWWWYREAGTAITQQVTFSQATGQRTAATIPVWTQPSMIALEPGYSFHVILEAIDAGTPALTRYRRIIIDVPTDGRSINGKTCPKIAVQARKDNVDFDAVPMVSDAAFSVDSEIRTLLDNPAARKVIERLAPELIELSTTHVEALGMSIRFISGFDPRWNDERMKQVDAELSKIPAADK
jgi:Protein of unknown function (DUF1593)